MADTERLAAAVVGATGSVGQRLVALLEGHPHFELQLLAASPRSVGRPFGDLWRLGGDPPEAAAALSLEPIDPVAIARRGIEVVFSALPSGAAAGIEEALARQGLKVFTDASAHRGDADVPLVVPEVNPDHLALVERQAARFPAGGFIVAVPNCTVAGLALPLRALGGTFPFHTAFVSTYQAISGAGYRGLAALEIAANLLPHIEGEEEKMAVEARKIFGTLDGGAIAPADLLVEAHCVRVPVREGHLETVTVVLEEGADAGAAAEALGAFRGLPQLQGLPTAPPIPIVVRREADRPQPLLDLTAGGPGRSRGMAVSVGRIRASGRHLKFVLLSHNTVRGGAGGNLLNAELARALGYLG